MKVLIACEFSGVVRDTFSRLGHDAWSCDILPTESPGNHIQGDVLEVLGNGWDLMIAHPHCAYLTTTANRVFANNPERWQARVDAAIFFKKLLDCGIPKIAIENPKGVISSYIRKPDQYIQPYEYGHQDSKMTGLWLKNLPKLEPTKIVEPIWIYPKSGSGKRMSQTHAKSSSTNNPKAALMRAKTYQGIADAMADQWGRE